MKSFRTERSSAATESISRASRAVRAADADGTSTSASATANTAPMVRTLADRDAGTDTAIAGSTGAAHYAGVAWTHVRTRASDDQCAGRKCAAFRRRALRSEIALHASA